jgi:hypothetical protein
VSSFFTLQQLKRGGKDRRSKTWKVVEVMNVIQFVRIRKVAAVPGGDDVAAVPCGKSQVAGIAPETRGHQLWAM